MVFFRHFPRRNVKCPNLASLREMLEHTGFKIIASGVISSMDGIEQLKTPAPNGVNQAICGKAVFEGKIDFKRVFKCLQTYNPFSGH